MGGYPKRYNDLIEAYVQPSTQVSCVTLRGGAVGTQGPITNVSSLRSGSEAYPLSGAVGGRPLHGPRAQVSSGRSPKPMASRSKPTSVRRRRRPSVRRRRPSVRPSVRRRRSPSNHIYIYIYIYIHMDIYLPKICFERLRLS